MQIKINQPLVEQLYATGNYDAMYFAGIIVNPIQMTHDDFNRWIDLAYFYMLADYVVAVTLAESPIAQDVADEWITSGEELKNVSWMELLLLATWESKRRGIFSVQITGHVTTCQKYDT